MNPYDLRCEGQVRPLGLAERQPHLSWKCHAESRGAAQAAYRILAAREPSLLASGEDLLWDSGRVESSQSTNVAYEGPPAGPGERVWWTVQVWDQANELAAAAPEWWEMGLLGPADWGEAKWIGGSLAGGPRTTCPAPHLRATLAVPGSVGKARLHVTALGLYLAFLNGARIGDRELAPGWTDYRFRVLAQTYDVSGQVREGDNVLGFVLGDGWYCGHLFRGGRQHYGDRPLVLARLVVDLADGSSCVLVSDRGFRVAYGPVLAADLCLGEAYDARRVMPGWSALGFDDAGWQPADVHSAPGIDVVPSAGPCVRVVAELTPSAPPRRLDEWESWWVYDVGANVVGRCKVHAAGPRGSTLVLRHGETLHPDGSVYLDNLGDARQLDAYTFAGHGVEEWEPSFTLHGFRYVQVEAYGETDPPELSVRVLRSDLERTGTFACSNPLLRSLYANIVRSLEGNLVDIPTDCPQRDERLGWTCDLQLVLPAAAYTFDLSRFLSKWLEDLDLGQTDEGAYPPVAPDVGVFGMTDGGPAWADAAVICAWRHYLLYGDERILRRHYAPIVRFFDYVGGTLIDGVRAHPDSPHYTGFGDWLAPEDALESCAGGTGEVETPLDLIGTAYLAHVADLMRRIAGTIGQAADARRFADAHARAVDAFRSRFCTPDGRLAVRSQTAHVLALRFGLLDDAAVEASVASLLGMIQRRGTRLSTGFLGAAHILDVLSDTGHADVAYALLLQTKYPSWLFQVVNGATTVWERWDGWSPERGFQDRTMNSFNHYVLGAVGAWMYRVIAGIDLDEASPGFRHAILRPLPGGGLTWAEATYETPLGRLSSAWSLDGERFEWEVAVPHNTTATVCLPLDPTSPVLESGDQLESADRVSPPRWTDKGVVLEVPGGHYHFSGSVSHGT